MRSTEVSVGHPTKQRNDPYCWRWAILGVELPCGEVRAITGPLHQLFAHGVISRMMTEPHGVWIWLAEHESWREYGTAIRAGLDSACNQLDQWDIERDEDAVLAAIAHDVIDHELHTYIESHGGSIAVEHVSDGAVSVVLSGACSHCSLANATLHLRLESAIRRRYPALREVRDVTPNQVKQRFSLFRQR